MSEKTMADNYDGRTTEMPPGSIVKAEVILFSDGSVHVGGCAGGLGEVGLVGALQTGIEMMGYDVEVSPTHDGQPADGVSVTSVHVPETTLIAEVAIG